jgi:hypothetical protein
VSYIVKNEAVGRISVSDRSKNFQFP